MEVETSSKKLNATNNTTVNRGIIYLKKENNVLPPQSHEIANWPTINSSNKVLKSSSNKKKQISCMTKPLEQNRSFKSALCGELLTSNSPKYASSESTTNIVTTEIKHEVDDVNENSWINVSSRKKNKMQVFQELTSNTNSPIPVNEKLNKKEELKLKKRLVREKKIKEERDLKRKDTKINVVSQDIIDSYNQQSTSNSFRSQVPKHLSFQAPKDSSSALQNDIQPPNITNIHSKSSSIFKKGKINIPLSEKNLKKKVKTKDLINLNIVDLIKKNGKKPVALNSIPRKEKIVIKVKPGKQSDIKKAKKSTLKKNMLREKKISQENFALYLAEIFQENLKIADVNVTTKCISELNVLALAEQDNLTQEPPPQQEILSWPISEHNLTTVLVPEGESCNLLVTEVNPQTKVIYEKNIVATPTPEGHLLEVNEMTENEHAKTTHLETFQTDLIREINYLCNPLHSRKFREYCNHFITEEINGLLTEFLELVVKFQVRLYENDPMKGKAKRRFYCGLKETFKHGNKLTCVVIAPDIKYTAGNGGLDELLKKIIDKAEDSNTSVVFGLNQRKLGQLTRRKCNVSCIGITNFQGAQEVHKKLMNAIIIQKEKYENARRSFLGENTSQNVNNV